MPGFLGSLANVAAKGAVAYGDQQQENIRALVLEKARQAALARQDRIDRDRDEDRLYKRQRDEIEDEYRGRVPGETSITTVEEHPLARAPKPPATFSARGLAAGTQASPSALTTPVTEGSLGVVPRTRVMSTPGGYDPEMDVTQVRAAAIRAAALTAQKERDTANADRTDARARTQHDYRMKEIGARENAISGRAGKAEKLTQFDAPLQRAVHGAIAKMKAAGIDKPDEQQIYTGAMNILGTDPVLKSHWSAGRITRDMVWGAVGARSDRLHEKPETAEEKFLREEDASVANPKAPARAVPKPRSVAGTITDPTDDEIDAAFDAGITDPAAVHAFVVKLRARKP